MTVASAGLAIFVKTPGHSPLKTRLAQAIGQDAAEVFHRHAAAAVADVVMQAQASMPGLVAYWAVAEADALDTPIWRALPRIAQGDGDLGARMRTVCGTLRERHGRAVLIGADAPQLRADDVLAAGTALDTHDHAIGPSEDGGFWLFGTRIAVPEHAWSETPWSQSDTAMRFLDALGDSSVATLRRLRDVDIVDDLDALVEAMRALSAPTPKQAALARWLHDLRFPA
ncbi:MAG: TIGR04282 family arsenosugar biosynthesis glycosyltransferase [Lysobacteraceae bacterium]